ncbi:hypothetical protein KNE206_62810 [Kitasatospora sp. NE20-6]|uniref:hypothetical protein n=1 Tax=Kitasatospora sp. NE20-6 TaxID=2859066 RepID=UPI0034DC7294
MLTQTANEETRLSFWLHVREFAVPPSMIEAATARRLAGDWAAACTAAHIDPDVDLRSLARTRGADLAARIRADLRHLAPDLLRWHMPRIAPRGLLRPGLTITLARYAVADRDGGRPVHLVARTPPAWADAGQRISLALWDGSHPEAFAPGHPHPHPDPRFRLDLHPHLWDARRAAELRTRSGADRPPSDGDPATAPALSATLPQGHGCAVDRWAAEAAILLHAESRPADSAAATGPGPGPGIATATGAVAGTVAVRLGARRWLHLDVDPGPDGIRPGPAVLRNAAASTGRHALSVLPDAATWVLPDLELLRSGAVEVDRLHPLVAPALVPGHVPAGPSGAQAAAGQSRLVDCRGARHRIGLVDGVLVPLDHGPAEIRREELLAALTGTPLPCLQAIDRAHRSPESLPDVRERLRHGDITGALAVVEGLLGADARLRSGALRDELEAAAQRRVTYGLFRAGLFRAGLTGPGQAAPDRRRPRERRSHPRHVRFH